MTRYLRLDDLVALAEELGVRHVRDLGLRDSAASRPRTTIYGEDAYATLDLKAAVLLESIARNHALVDGNERLAWVAVVVFYGLNGCALRAPQDAAYDLVIAVATGTFDYREVAERLAGWASDAPA